ncbi:hypothetical protein C8Q76DRAFT_701507 [Earliella scabrosa]|nr:hypothetical protein C8Q76DRAFT_701507 [Earliella scabrosa]
MQTWTPLDEGPLWPHFRHPLLITAAGSPPYPATGRPSVHVPLQDPHTPIPTAMDLLSLPDHVFHELAATRYMSAAGLMILFYDHLLTFGDEVELIWTAPATYAKYTFLLNRYSVLATLLAVAYETCGFVETTFTDQVCKQFIFVCSMIAIVSVGIANLLILQRVVILWEHRPIILKIMAAGFLISFATQVTTMIIMLIESLPFITWSRVFGMCIATKASPVLIAVWASPLLFEVFVLGSTALNALDRPRTVELPIIKALHSDGIGFFLSITCCRIVNLSLAAIGRPSLTFLAVFFIWAMTTTVLSRLLLHLRRAECSPPSTVDPLLASPSPYTTSPSSASSSYPPYRIPSLPLPLSPTRTHTRSADWDRRAISPFGLVPLAKSVSAGSARSTRGTDAGRTLSPASTLEQEEVYSGPRPPQYHYRKRTYDPNVRPWD